MKEISDLLVEEIKKKKLTINCNKTEGLVGSKGTDRRLIEIVNIKQI